MAYNHRSSGRSFPESWRHILSSRMPAWSTLEPDEQGRLEHLVGVFVADKLWEGVSGLDLTDEMRLTISGHACLLILELDLDHFRDVTSIIVYPTAPTRRGERSLGGGIMTEEPVHLLGEAMLHGPVMIAWDAVLRAGTAGRARNVVHHEFAHKLDMLDGFADGVPPIRDRTLREQFAASVEHGYRELAAGLGRPFLDAYAATNRAEFFAVATEAFFGVPARLREGRPDLYRALGGYYGQDPAVRQGGQV